MSDSYSIVVDRLGSHVELQLQLDAAGKHKAYIRMPQLRGFEYLLQGRPAEEVPRIASRIFGICPWPHHLASLKAVENAMDIEVSPTVDTVHHLALLLSQLGTQLAYLYMTNAPDLLQEECGRPKGSQRTLFELTEHPHVREAVFLYTRLHRLLTAQSPSPLQVDSMVVGGMLNKMNKEFLTTARAYVEDTRQFCVKALQRVKRIRIPYLQHELHHLGAVDLPMLSSVDKNGNLSFWNARCRYMQSDGSFKDMPPLQFMNGLVEEYGPWTQCAFPRVKKEPALNLDPDAPAGMYTVGALPRINACSGIDTKLAQKALEDFRQENGPLPQAAYLYHWARFIQMLHWCEKAMELLNSPHILGTDIRQEWMHVCSGSGFAVVEAARGPLFYKVDLGEKGIVQQCQIIAPTTQNNAAMHVTLSLAARKLMTAGPPSKKHWHKLSMCLRNYDPCPSCAVH